MGWVLRAVLAAAALASAALAVTDDDELKTKSEAIAAVKTKGDVIAILCTTPRTGKAWKQDLEVFNRVQKSFEFAKQGVVFLWTSSFEVSDMWVKPELKDDMQARQLPSIVVLSAIDEMGGKLRRNKKHTKILPWPGVEAKKNLGDKWSEGLQAQTEIFILRLTQPFLTEVNGNNGNWIAGDGSVDAQDRLQILMRNQLPKAICLSNVKGAPEIMKLAMKIHRDDFLGVFFNVDSLKSAQTILPSFGFSKKEISNIYNDVADGELVTVVVDPFDGRRSPIHRDIGGVELLLKEFADATPHRPPFNHGNEKKKKKKTKKKKATKKKKRSDL